MELQIQDLVSSIKKDGIESANKEAAAIIADIPQTFEFVNRKIKISSIIF